MDAIDVSLSQPVQAHGKDVTVLTFRPVTTKDIRQCGWPFIVAKDGEEQRIDAEAICKYIVNSAQIPPSSVDMMAPADFKAAMVTILGFFGAPTPAAP